MSILPEALSQCLAVFRPLLRHEVYLTFTYVMTGLLAGEAKWGAVRGERLRTRDVPTVAHLGLLHHASRLAATLDGRARRTGAAASLRRGAPDAALLDCR
mgnify:CR=1 FL=1